MQSTDQVRVVDPILSDHARGYTNAEYVGDALFPVAPMPTSAAKRIEFGRESFRRYKIDRAPGANILRVSYGILGKPVNLIQKALSAQTPVEHQREGGQVPGINVQQGNVDLVLDIIEKDKEIAQATVARDAALYPASNKLALIGADRFDDPSSDPEQVIGDAKEVIRARIGREPNICLLGARVAKSLRRHPNAKEMFKYTSGGSINQAQLREFLDFDNVVVGKGIYDDDNGVTADIWGDDIILAYVSPATTGDVRRNIGLPSYGYTYQLDGHPYVEPVYYDKLDSAGAVVSQTTAIEALRQNSGSRTVWRLFDGDGGGRTPFMYAAEFAAVIGAVAVSDDEIVMTAAEMFGRMNDGPSGPQNSLIFEVAFENDHRIHARKNIAAVRDGLDGVSPVAIEVTPTSHQVAAGYDRFPSPGSLPKFTSVRATRAGQPVAVSISALAATGCAASVLDGSDGSKAVRIDALAGGMLAATGSVTFTATAGDQAAPYRIAVEKLNAVAPVIVGGGGGGEPGTVSQLYVNTPVSTSAYNQIGSTRAFMPGASGTMRFSFEGLYEAQLVTGQISTAAIAAKLQYRVGEGPWIDVPGSETEGGFASRDGREQQSYEQISEFNAPGYLSGGAVDVAGIGGAGQARLLARLTGGNTTAVLDATATIEVR